jgi:hypothetical protein
MSDEIKLPPPDYVESGMTDSQNRADGAQQGDTKMIGRTCMVRTFSAGVFAGVLESRDGKEAVLSNARRIWYWAGAASLSQLAIDGTSKPSECKFPIAVPEVLLTEVIEIIPMTEKAVASIAGVPVWEK